MRRSWRGLQVRLEEVDGKPERLRAWTPQLARVEVHRVAVLRVLTHEMGGGVGEDLAGLQGGDRPGPPADVPGQPGVTRVIAIGDPHPVAHREDGRDFPHPEVS